MGQRITSRTIELRIPSELSYEKVAMSSAATVARRAGFPADRIEDVKTAVSEACINAIQHGPRRARSVRIRITLREADLLIEVSDGGCGFDPRSVEAPDIRAKVAGRNSPRGWGLFLIRHLVNDLEVTGGIGRGNRVTFRMRPQRPAGEGGAQHVQ